ncbi:TPA: beta strand repeat-containing protein, partial [Escherichia coli]
HDINLTGNSQTGVGLQLKGTNTLTATNGSINLTGNSTNGTGLFLGGNKTLRASNGNINLTGNSQTGVGLYLGERNNTNTLTATNGSINLNGVSETKSAIEIRGSNTLTADNINLTGNSTNGTGIDLDGNNSWTAANITITGCSSHTGLDTQGSLMGRGVYLHGDLTFTGNVAINGTANAGAGVGFSAQVNMTFNNGTAVINGTSTGIDISNGISNKVIYGAGVADVVVTGEKTQKNITLLNSNLTINGHSHNAAGIAGWSDVKYEETTKWNISGNGNITINASSVEYDGFQNVVINASGLNGTTTLHGTSTNGSGVYLENMNMTNVTISGSSVNSNGVDITGNSTLTNTTVSGNGTDGSGVNISGNLTSSGNSTVTGNASGSGNGVNISGNITAGVISGGATGNGSGVDISGNSTLTNTTVNGNGTDG